MQLPVNLNISNSHDSKTVLTRQNSKTSNPLFVFDYCLAQANSVVNSGKRKAVESYISKRFKDVHQANVDHFLPILMTVSHLDELGSAIGIQLGSQGPMFLEHYLSSPVEQQIAALERKPVSRNQIAEIGNLVITHKPSGFILFLVLASALHKAGFKWMTFTATPVVEKMINRLGYAPFFLAEANAGCLGDAAKEWGCYYEKQPRVMVGNIDDAMSHLEQTPVLKNLVSAYDDDIDVYAGLLMKETTNRFSLQASVMNLSEKK